MTPSMHCRAASCAGWFAAFLAAQTPQLGARRNSGSARQSTHRGRKKTGWKLRFDGKSSMAGTITEGRRQARLQIKGTVPGLRDPRSTADFRDQRQVDLVELSANSNRRGQQRNHVPHHHEGNASVGQGPRFSSWTNKTSGDPQLAWLALSAIQTPANDPDH